MHNSSGQRLPLICVCLSAALLLPMLCSRVNAQSTKGAPTQQTRLFGQPQTSLAQSPGLQIRQQQQQQQQYSSPSGSQTGARVSSPPATSTNAGTKRRPQTAGPQFTSNSYDSAEQKQQQESSTEDPLADSEPALYGSVAGQPGVDFPAYTRIPKTSFTCEGKGFDFGFYADQEADCQVYHVCWSGRRESFLCGVGTVFNQAILACDYWHSVDCSKSSQFYGVNSELGEFPPLSPAKDSLPLNSRVAQLTKRVNSEILPEK